MKRRNLLYTAGAGVTFVGAFSIYNLGEKLQVSIEDIDEVPREYGIQPIVEIQNNTITNSHTARLRVTLKNHSNRQITISDGSRGVFSAIASEQSKPELLLLEADNNPLSLPNCWRPLLAQSQSMELRHAMIDRQSSALINLNVWGSNKNKLGQCVPTGDFTFKTHYSILSGKTHNTGFDWGFTISIKPIKLEA